MYTFTCPVCGTVKEVKYKSQVLTYCSNKCYGEAKGLAMDGWSNQQRSRWVNPKGFDNLVAAVCWQAKKDFLENPPGHYLREDAKRFFLSDEFSQLTQLDGENIVKRLEMQYQRKVKRRSAKYGGKCSS